MKKKVILSIAAIIAAISLTGCTQKDITHDFGGSMTITLEPNQKLEEITWKDNNIWYLTRPMREDEKAETHTFQEDSSWGVFKGTVTVIERKE